MGTMPKAQSRGGAFAATSANLHQANQGAPPKHLEYANDGQVLFGEVRYSMQGNPYPHNLAQADHVFHIMPARDGAATSDKVAFQEISNGNQFAGTYHIQSATYSSKKPPISQNSKGTASAAHGGASFSQPVSGGHGKPLGQQHAPPLSAHGAAMRSSLPTSVNAQVASGRLIPRQEHLTAQAPTQSSSLQAHQALKDSGRLHNDYQHQAQPKNATVIQNNNQHAAKANVKPSGNLGAASNSSSVNQLHHYNRASDMIILHQEI